MPKPVIQTNFIVLRKIPYSETSLIVAGLSPASGQLRFVVHGARKIAKKKMPVVDIFRMIHVKYGAGKSDLHTWREGELVANYGDVARDFGLYETAAWAARFILKHTAEGVECPHLFLALKTGLKRLADSARDAGCAARENEKGKNHVTTKSQILSGASEKKESLSFAVKSGLILVYLSENGLMPDYPWGTPEERQLTVLLEAALGSRPPPPLSALKWRDIFTWGQTLLNTHAGESEESAPDHIGANRQAVTE